MTDLKGKVVLVTGGGTGIGGAVARRFVNRGAQVVVVGRRVDVVEQLASEIGALALQCDVGVTESVEQAIAQLVERCGGLDIVVNNAATVQIGNVEQLDDAAWSSVVEINVNGPMRVARARFPTFAPEAAVRSSTYRRSAACSRRRTRRYMARRKPRCSD